MLTEGFLHSGHYSRSADAEVTQDKGLPSTKLTMTFSGKPSLFLKPELISFPSEYIV